MPRTKKSAAKLQAEIDDALYTLLEGSQALADNRCRRLMVGPGTGRGEEIEASSRTRIPPSSAEEPDLLVFTSNIIVLSTVGEGDLQLGLARFMLHWRSA